MADLDKLLSSSDTLILWIVFPKKLKLKFHMLLLWNIVKIGEKGKHQTLHSCDKSPNIDQK